uniref:Uncharacterized protein n=1 Tax=Leersia perrieri TaxID=77586 RepID=A0A0D9VHQ0_9ORYZ
MAAAGLSTPPITIVVAGAQQKPSWAASRWSVPEVQQAQFSPPPLPLSPYEYKYEDSTKIFDYFLDYVAADPEGAEGVRPEFAADAHTIAVVGRQEWYDYVEPEGKSCPLIIC